MHKRNLNDILIDLLLCVLRRFNNSPAMLRFNYILNVHISSEFVNFFSRRSCTHQGYANKFLVYRVMLDHAFGYYKEFEKYMTYWYKVTSIVGRRPPSPPKKTPTETVNMSLIDLFQVFGTFTDILEHNAAIYPTCTTFSTGNSFYKQLFCLSVSLKS